MPRATSGMRVVRRRLAVAVMVGGLALGAMPATAATASGLPRTATPAVAAVAFTGVTVTKAAGADAVDVTAMLTADGSPLPDEDAALYVKSPVSTTYAYYEDVSSDSSGALDFYVDGTYATDAVFAGTPITFKLVHEASASGGAASYPIDWVPPATTLTIHAPPAAKYGGLLKIPGTLKYAGGGALPTATTVELQTRLKGSSNWSIATTEYPGSHGKFAFAVASPRHDSDLRAVFLSGSPGAASAVSDTAGLVVNAAVSAVVSPAVLPLGGKATVAVTVGPKTTGGPVTLERKSDAGWKVVAKGELSKDSQHSWPVKVGHKQETTSYRVVRGSTAQNGGGISAMKSLTVERHGGGSPTDHAFLYEVNGKPVRWNPCQAIHYRVNLDEAPKGALADVRETLRRIAQPTRIHFRYDGHTRYIPGSSGNQTSPLVIAWAKPSETSLPLGGGTLGEGGGTYTYGDGQQPHIATGYAVLDATATLMPGFGAGQTEGALLMHELGHAIGLDHAAHASQIMYPFLGPHPATMYGAGDYRGLQLLGRSQGCLS